MHPAARRYAKAIFDLAVEQNALDRVSADMRDLAQTMESSPELVALMSSPTVSPATRKAIMEQVVQRAGVSPLVRNAVLLMTDHRRASLLPEVTNALMRLADERAGKLRAEVVSAAPLSEAQYTRLTGALERLTGRKITLVRKIDPALIGGVITRVGDTVYDGSVRARLDEIRRALMPS